MRPDRTHLYFSAIHPALSKRNHLESFKMNVSFHQVWPGLTAYPDFSDEVTHEWWYDNLKKFYDMVPFDGLWIVSVDF